MFKHRVSAKPPVNKVELRLLSLTDRLEIALHALNGVVQEIRSDPAIRAGGSYERIRGN